MINYLLQILENNNRVIIPEFGAFIIKHRDPLTIVFNEFLQYNDGQLIDIVSKLEKTDREQARQKIEEFVSAINDTLNKGDNYSLGNLGTLTKSPTGRISLEEAENEEHLKASRSRSDLKPKEEKDLTIKETTDPHKEIEPLPEKTKARPEVKPKDDIPAAKVEKPEQSEIQEKPKPKHVETVQPKIAKSPVIKEDYSKKQSDETKIKGRKINVIVWIVLILVVNGIIIAYFLLSDNLTGLLNTNHPQKESLITEKPAMAKENATPKVVSKTSEQVMTAIEDSVKKIIQEKTSAKPITTSGKRYYIVAGVFSSEQNAKKLVKELKKKGYNSENFGMIGSLYAVSYDVATSKEDADKLLARIKKDFDPKAWVKVKE